MIQAVRTVLLHAVSMVAAGWAAYHFVAFAPKWLHLAIIGVSAGLVTVLSTISTKVLDKFSDIQKDAETAEHAARTDGIYDYVHAARVELVVFFFATVVLGVINGGIAVALLSKDAGISDVGADRLIGFGYANAVFIALFAVRATRMFLRVDVFRKDVFKMLTAEKARVAALRALTASDLTPMPANRRRRRRPTSDVK